MARIGGDEFAILHVSEIPTRSAEALARRLIESVSAPYYIDGHEIRIGISIGIQISSRGGNNPDSLLSDADSALYRIKQSGKGTFGFA